ncbi:Wall-associated receptor kinase, partial [Theobroma cacao]
MHPPSLQLMFWFCIIINVILLIAPKSAFANDGDYSSCSTRFRCGNIDTVYPFWGLERPEDCEDVCVQYLRNTTLTTGVFEYNSNTQDMTLYYGCRPLTNLPSLPRGLSSQCECEINGTGIGGYYVTRNITESVTVPVLKSEVQAVEDNPNADNLTEALKVGFELQWFANDSFCDLCVDSCGQCGYNHHSSESLCYCSGGSYLSTCPQ